MKSLLALTLAVTAFTVQGQLTEDQVSKIKGYYEECLASTGVDNSLILRGRNKDFVEEDKLMAYYHCFMVKMGFQEADGTLKPEVMLKMLPSNVPADLGKQMIDGCTQSSSKSSKERTAFDVCKCFITNSGSDMSFFA